MGQATKGNGERPVLFWVAGGCAATAVIVALAYVLTTPPIPAEAVAHAAFTDNPPRTENIVEVAESIAEQVIPYNCQATADTGTAVDARCNLSFSLNHPLELRIEAPFRVNMSTTGRDIFGRTTLVIQESNPIISEMAVNGLSLDKLNETEAKTGEVKETIGNVGSEIRNLLGN